MALARHQTIGHPGRDLFERHVLQRTRDDDLEKVGKLPIHGIAKHDSLFATSRMNAGGR